MKGKEILILGGTGSLAKALVIELAKYREYNGIRLFSRDEYKQWKLKESFKEIGNISYLIGDVRDQNRLNLAMRGVDIVINCAAMKQVPSCEENPLEAVKTNIDGAANIVHAAILNKVEKVLHISTDKAVNPLNLYGATKTVAEKLFLHSNVYTPNGTKFSCCRYGNVLGSRGSIVELIRKIRDRGVIPLTDKDMSRFWITLPQVADFILHKLEIMGGNEIFIPKMPSMKVIDMIKTLAPRCEIDIVGIRPGEKLHETLINAEESQITVDYGEYMTIDYRSGLNVSPEEYTSGNNDYWMSPSDLLNAIGTEEEQREYMAMEAE